MSMEAHSFAPADEREGFCAIITGTSLNYLHYHWAVHSCGGNSSFFWRQMPDYSLLVCETMLQGIHTMILSKV